MTSISSIYSAVLQKNDYTTNTIPLNSTWKTAHYNIVETMRQMAVDGFFANMNVDRRVALFTRLTELDRLPDSDREIQEIINTLNKHTIDWKAFFSDPKDSHITDLVLLAYVRGKISEHTASTALIFWQIFRFHPEAASQYREVPLFSADPEEKLLSVFGNHLLDMENVLYRPDRVPKEIFGREPTRAEQFWLTIEATYTRSTQESGGLSLIEAPTLDALLESYSSNKKIFNEVLGFNASEFSEAQNKFLNQVVKRLLIEGEGKSIGLTPESLKNVAYIQQEADLSLGSFSPISYSYILYSRYQQF